ncbi:MAG: hypothetical protein J0H82_06410 [Alphaproteobacteria bacterium]|jgi:hypothetical protein|nr:hypothetical protein [Alphaproteobacteria bacterium]
MVKMENPTPADMLASAARTLHGDEQWRLRFARDLDIDDDTLRRWMTGRTTLLADHGVFDDTIALLRRRAAEISARANQLERWLLLQRGVSPGAIAAPTIRLSRRQAKEADRQYGIELIVPYPQGLNPPKLGVDEEVDATAEEAAWARSAVAGAPDLAVSSVKVVRLVRPTGLPREGETETHLAIILIGQRWLNAQGSGRPKTMWYGA